MRIALVSYEYAGVASGGGIGTYVRHVAAMLAGRGHQVEVFTHDAPPAGERKATAVQVHAVAGSRGEFKSAVLPAFAARHAAASFDVVEGPEYGADASTIAAAFPHLPLVVKLHTPTFLIDAMNRTYMPASAKARFLLGGLRRGRIPRPYWTYDPAADPERAGALAAAEITAPSRAILRLLADRWDLPPDRLAHVPHPFSPSSALLDVPADTHSKRVTFVGRLEPRKGVIDLAHALRRVLAMRPATRVRIVGRASPHPSTGEDMRDYMRRVIGRRARAVEFTGGVPASDIPARLDETDICDFPSVWEASGYVCMEAMAAARGVVASAGSGMAEIIADGQTGRLVPPRSPAALARAIVELLDDPARRIAMGRAARAHVLAAYGPDVIAPLQEASYRRAISRARVEGKVDAA